VRRRDERRLERLVTHDLAEAARYDLREPDPAARAGEDRGDLLGPHRDVGIVDGLGRLRKRAVSGEVNPSRAVSLASSSFTLSPCSTLTAVAGSMKPKSAVGQAAEMSLLRPPPMLRKAWP